MGSITTLTAKDGKTIDAYRAEPVGKPRGAVVVIQEIWGVNSHIRAVADAYAADGYVAIALALFDRVEPKVMMDAYTPETTQRGRDLAMQLVVDTALLDVQAAVNLGAGHGKVGVVGYCLYAADHGFNCDLRASFDAAAAKLARERTLAFFRSHVG